jgi:hypothetical protein
LTTAIPWLVAGAAVVKGIVAIETFRLALRLRLLDRRASWCAVGVWLALTACAVGMATLLLPMENLTVPMPILFLGIATLMPLVRYPLATLALEWNRHR